MMEALAMENPLLGRVDDELLEQLGYMFRKAVPGLRRRLVNRVGCAIRVELKESVSMTIGEALDAAAVNPAALGEFQLAPNNRALVLLDGRVLARLLGMMLGENPASPLLTARHLLTRVDLRIGRRICVDLLETISVQAGLERESKFIDLRPAPRVLSWLPRSTRVLCARLEFGPEEAPFGTADVLIPLGACSVLFGTAPLHDEREAHVESVLPVQVDVIAELARVQMSLSDLSKLSVGTEIDLGRSGDVLVTINGKHMMVAEAGESDGTRSIRVLGRMA